MDGVTMTVAPDEGKQEGLVWMDGWRVTLRYQGRRMTVSYYMGEGHGGAEPTLDTVLESLVMDDPHGEAFEDWCGNYDYDTDSRSAEKIYRACVSQTRRLHQLLGDDFDRIANQVQEIFA